MSFKPSDNTFHLDGNNRPMGGNAPDFNREGWAFDRLIASRQDGSPDNCLERKQLIANDHYHELLAQSFYMEMLGSDVFGSVIPTGSDLVDANVIDVRKRSDLGVWRNPLDVQRIIIKETSRESRPDFNIANYLINDRHISINQLQNPDYVKQILDPDHAHLLNEIVVYLDDGTPSHHHDLSEREKASLRLLLSWKDARYPLAQLMSNLPEDVMKALNDEIVVSTEAENNSVDRFNTHPLPEWIIQEWPRDRTSDDTCGKLADVPQKGTKDYVDFVEKLVHVLSVNEGKKTSITPDDNGAGISVGEAQWNQKKGELPDLLQAWLDDDQKHHRKFFKTTFAPYLDQMITSGKIDDGKIRAMNMGGNDDFLNRMQDALNDKSYQGVQDNLVRAKAEKAITVAKKYGHHSQRFIAEVLDVANEKGWGGCEARLRKANVAGIPEEEECTALKKFELAASDRVHAKERDKNLDRIFAPNRTSFAPWLPIQARS